MGLILKAGGSLLVMGSVVLLSMLGSQFADKLNVSDRLLQAEREKQQLREENRELSDRAQKLAMANRLLKVNYLLAKVRMKSQIKDKDTGKLVSVVEFTEVDDQENPLSKPQEYQIHGGELHIEGLVAKFEDEYVEAGDPRRGTALFAFRRLYGDDEAASTGYLIPSNRSQPGAYAQGGLPTEAGREVLDQLLEQCPRRVLDEGQRFAGLHGTAGITKLQEGFEYRVRLGSRGDFTIENIDTKSGRPKSDLLNNSRRAESWQGE